MVQDIIGDYLEKHIALAASLRDAAFVEKLIAIAGAASAALHAGGKLVLFGNGGSAADAQHIATELVSKFGREREALPALALNTNTSIITAVANDYTYDRIFARQVEALVDRKDLVIGISTSGNSESVIAGIRVARQKGATTAGLTGRSGGRLVDAVDICLNVPSEETPLIQEMHITIGHILCHLIENDLPGQLMDIPKKSDQLRHPVRIIALDIDGVLTDGTVAITEEKEIKSLFYRDMDAINHGRRQGLDFALITAEATPFVELVSERLRIATVIKDAKDKAAAIDRLSAENGVPREQICYIGDSKRDAAAIRSAGFGLAPADADSEAREAARHVLKSRGGRGAVAEAVYLILEHNATIKTVD